MTKQKSFKRLVRARMEKTGESYTAARAALLGGSSNGSAPADSPVMVMSDEAIRERTGFGWEEWFDMLDEAGATDWSHRDTARWLREEQGVPGWDSQSITVGYERARLGRGVGETATGFSITASKTVAVPVETLFDAWVDEIRRREWLPDGQLRERKSTRPRTARYDWGDGTTRVIVGFESKGPQKSVVALQHERLADRDEADRTKAYWRERVSALKAVLEGAS